MFNIAENFDFVRTYFTSENIIEPIMRVYNDFDYVNYILNLSFKDGFKLYLKCIDIIREEKEEKIKDNVRQVWLIDIQQGCKLDFEEYYNNCVKRSEEKLLGHKFKEEEESRIIEDIENKKDIKLKERVFDL